MDKRPQCVRMGGPRSERGCHRLEIGARRVSVLNRAFPHRGGEQPLRVGLSPLGRLGTRGVTPHGGRDLEVRDTGGVEQRADLAPHLRLATVLVPRSEEHTSELQSHSDLVCRLLLEKKKKNKIKNLYNEYE